MTGSSIYDYAHGSTAPRIRTPVTGLGIAVIVLLAFDATLAALSAVFMARRQTRLGRVLPNAAAVDPDQLRHANEAVRESVGWFVILTMATAVVFLCWFWVARNNAGAYGSGPATLGVWWSIGAWFVPVATVVIPLVVARDIYRGTMQGRKARPAGGGQITGWWWAAYVAFCVTGMVAAVEVGHADNLVPRDDHLRGLQSATRLGVIAQALGAVAALLAIAYVGIVTKTQNARFREGMKQGIYGYAYWAPVQDRIPGAGVQDAVPGGVQDAIPDEWRQPPR